MSITNISPTPVLQSQLFQNKLPVAGDHDGDADDSAGSTSGMSAVSDIDTNRLLDVKA